MYYVYDPATVKESKVDGERNIQIEFCQILEPYPIFVLFFWKLILSEKEYLKEEDMKAVL